MVVVLVSLGTLTTGLLVAGAAGFLAARSPPDFRKVNWNAVQSHVRHAFDHIARRVRVSHPEITIRQGRTDSEAGDLVFIYCVFDGTADTDDAICLGVSFRSLESGHVVESTIDLSGESSGRVWAELYSGLLHADESELVRLIQGHLTATEELSDRVDERIDALGMMPNSRSVR